MLPYVPHSGPGAGSFSTATVQPLAVPVPLRGSGMQVAGFQIARIGSVKGQTVTTVTTAVAVFGGRVQATLGSVSNFVFPIDTQTKLIQDLEARVAGVSLY